MSTYHSQQNLRCGDDWDFTGSLNDENGTPLDLTGATISWKLDSLDGKTNYLTLSLGTGITVVNATTNQVTWGPTGAQTGGLTPQTYKDYLVVTLAAGLGGGIFTVVEGIINASPKPV